MKPHAVVIGGGFAGAASASALTEAGVTVTLLEQRATLGGRTSSLRDGVTKEEVDNGQHLFLGAYRDTRLFLRRLKVEGRLQFLSALRIPFYAPAGKRYQLSCPSLPGSLGLLAGIAGYSALSLGEQASLVRGMTSLMFRSPNDLSELTVTAWLNKLRQPPGARRAFWTPLCFATLNESPDIACAAALAAVLREGFLRDPSEAALGYSKVSLSKLWPVELAAYLKRQGGVVAPNQPATGFETLGRRVSQVRTASGDLVDADVVICAVPLPSFLKICPEELRPTYKDLESVTFSSIASINFWFSKPVMNDLFAGLLDTDVQWIFNRYRLWDGLGASPGYVSLVLSGAGPFAKLSSDELLRLGLKDLRRCFPHIENETPHGTVVWEKQATPSPSPANWKRRPPVTTALENFFLAGDWVDTGLPATIEAATRSGHAAAAAAMRHLKKENLVPAGTA